MDSINFEKALIKKLLEEIENPENWENLAWSIYNKNKNIAIYIGDRTISIISPEKYEFVNSELTTEVYQKCKKIFDDNKLKKKLKARSDLAEKMGINTRKIKLEVLDDISKETETDISKETETDISKETETEPENETSETSDLKKEKKWYIFWRD